VSEGGSNGSNMDISSFDFGLYGLCLAVSALAIFLLCRKAVFHVFDPWIFIFINQTFTITYAAYAYLQGDLRPSYFLYISFSLLAFFVGLNLFAKWNRSPREVFVIFTPRALSAAIIFVVIYQGLFDLIFILNRGLPILYEGGPTPTMYAGGFGIVKFVHAGVAMLLPILSWEALYLYRKKKLFFIGMAAVAYPALLMEQGKTGLIGLLFAYVAFIYYYNQILGGKLKVPTKLLLWLAAIGALYIPYRFYVVVSGTNYEATVLLAIVKRFINTADAIYMYFVLEANRSFREPLNILSYYTSLLSPYVGYKDDIAQKFALLLHAYAFGDGDVGYGASPSMQVIGFAAFNYYGVIYCFVVGLLLSIVKFTNVFKSNLLVFLVVYGTVSGFTSDAAQSLYYLSNLMFLIPPIACAFLVADIGGVRSVFHFKKIRNGPRGPSLRPAPSDSGKPAIRPA